MTGDEVPRVDFQTNMNGMQLKFRYRFSNERWLSSDIKTRVHIHCLQINVEYVAEHNFFSLSARSSLTSDSQQVIKHLKSATECSV